MMLNEIVGWYKKRKNKLMLLKIDFIKGIWRIILGFVGSNDGIYERWWKYWSWIQAYVIPAWSSILVNGSPTPKFELQRGLRQGYPLPPFLFIIVMEGVHVDKEDPIAVNL